MIFFVSKYLYFLLVLAFISIIGISQVYSGDNVSVNIAYIYTILLLPLVDICVESIKDEIQKYNWKIDGGSFLKFVLSFVMFLIAYKKGLDPLGLATLLFFTLGILFRFNARIAFYISLFCFAYVGIYMLIDQKGIAEKVSIYAYYFLIIGVIMQIRQSVQDKKNNLIEQ